MKDIYKTLLFLVLLLLCYSSNAQRTYISGYITDSETGDILQNVSIYSSDNFEVSNRFGYFTINTKENETISFSLNKYSVLVLKLNDSVQQNIFNIKLTPIFQNEINTLSDSAKNPSLNNTDVGVNEFSIEQVKKQPSIFGEADILKSLQTMPGVKPGNETGSKYSVRGGSFDQNLVLIDGIPMYQRGHIFGLYSTLHPDMFNSVKLYKSGFPTHLGGRLSSVLDLEMKQGGKYETRAQMTTSLFVARFQIDGPLDSKGKTTYNLGLRRSLLDIYGLNEESDLPIINFFDINLKLSHNYSEKDKMFLSFVAARDRVQEGGSYTDTLQTGILTNTYEYKNITANTGLNLKWNHIVNSKKFQTYSVVFSNYINKFLEEDSVRFSPDTAGYIPRRYTLDNKYRTGVLDIILKGDYFNNQSASRNIKYGWESNFHVIAPGGSQIKQIEFGNNLDTIIGNYKRNLFPEISVYAENKFRLKKKSFLQLGLRISTLINKSFFIMPDPRLVYVNPINNNSTFKLSYSLMHQPMHMVKNNISIFSMENWFPANSDFKPQRAHQVSMSFDHSLEKGYSFTAQSYLKYFERILEKKEGLSIFSVFRNNTLEDVMEEGEGFASGLELLLKRNKGRFQGWISYSLSFANRKFENINFSERYPYKFDRRQMLSVVSSYRLSDYYELSFNLDLANGNRATLPISKYYNINGDIVYDYGSRNWYQLPTYIRLDVNLTRSTMEFSSEYNRYWQFGIRNITNNFNPSSAYFNAQHQTNGASTPRYEGVSLLGNLMPYVTYTLKF